MYSRGTGEPPKARASRKPAKTTKRKRGPNLIVTADVLEHVLNMCSPSVLALDLYAGLAIEGMNRQLVKRCVQRLLKTGLLHKEGEKRNTKYFAVA